MAEHLKLPEVARRLDVSEKTARRYIKSGALPSVFIGRTYRVSEEDLEAFLKDAKVMPGDDSPKGSAPTSRQPSLDDTVDERRFRYLQAWQAFVWNVEKRWEEKPPETSGETSVILDALHALQEEGAFDLGTTQGDEWTHLKFLLAGLERLNDIADTIEKSEEAERRRAEFTVIQEKIGA